MFPISSKVVVLLVDPFWKELAQNQNLLTKNETLITPILPKYISFAQCNYINSSSIKRFEDIEKYKHKNDTYTFNISTIDDIESNYLNHLIINEAKRYIGFKTPNEFIDVVKSYNTMLNSGVPNIHHNLNGFINLLSNIK